MTGELHVRAVAAAPRAQSLLAHRASGDRPFCLVSGAGDPRLARWSYGALEPAFEAASLSDASERMRTWCSASGDGLPPLATGAVGYIGYDLGWARAPRPRTPRADPLGLPSERWLGFDALYARDEQTNEGWLIAQPGADATARLDRLARAVSTSLEIPPGGLTTPLEPAVSRRAHEGRVAEALELIAAGEIYQVNLTYPLRAGYAGAPEAAFARLCTSPPPFAAFLHLGDGQAIVSASPECFFDFDGPSRAIATYPIKGTRRRHANPDRDRASAAELLRDPKERAEHVMIVDLLRNDVGRFAECGSVAVEGLAYVESFPTVHHLTSRIVGRLVEGVTHQQLMDALFPGGSITGAPKLRAMEIIDALEDSARGVYTGAIGYVTPSGSIRTSIAIRTASFANGELSFGVGGGIVADSVPSREWEETELKAMALARALGG